MIHVALNPPKKSGGKGKGKGTKAKGKGKGRKHKGPRVCMPKSDFRYAKSLRKLKRKILRKHPRRKVICFPKSVIRAASSLKKLKHHYLGTKYGFARHPFLRAGGSAVPKPMVSVPKSKRRAAPSAAEVMGARMAGPYGMSTVPSYSPRGYGFPKSARTGVSAAARRMAPPMGPYGSYVPGSTAAKRRPMSKGKGKGKGQGKGRKITYAEYLALLPWERKQLGIRPSDVRAMGKKGYAFAKSPAAPKPPKAAWPKGDIYAANPMRARNYPLPIYSLNDAAELGSLRDGLTAGYRPSALMAALPIVGGLVGNSLLAALANKLVSKKFTLDDKWKNPVGLAVGLGTAGALAAITRLIAPKYAGKVFLGAMAQVSWDAYQNYVAPKIKKTLGLDGMRGWDAGPDTFGLWCDECDNKDEDIGDFYPRPVARTPVMTIPATVDQIVGTVVPNSAVTVQAPPNVSAPTRPQLVAKVNGKVVPVERIAPPADDKGVGEFGDFLTPNQVASATSLGDTGDMSSYL